MAQASAVDYGRQRSLLQSAQTLVAELRALPLDPATTRASYPRMFELVRMVKRYSEATAALPADETRAMWEQRGQWLQEEVAGLAQERIYSPDQQQYWLNLLLLLFAGAEACDRALREKLELELALQGHSRQAAELQEQLRAARAEAEQAARRTAVPPDLAEELFALRSKAAVLGTELDKGRAELAAAQQQMQLLVAERDSLHQQVDGLRAEVAAATNTASSRLEVIQQLMERTETSSSQGQAAAAEVSRLQVHCRTLSVNLETNAKVIEKLVELNSELMDSLNAATATAEIKGKQQQQPGAAAAGGAAAAAAGGLEPRRASSNGGGAADGGASTAGTAAGGGHRAPSWTQRNGLYGTAGVAGPPPPPPPPPAAATSAAANGAAAQHGVPRVPSRGGGLASAAVSSSRGGGEPESLTEAFAAFLRDETPPKPATAAVLATPPPPPPPTGPTGAHHAGGAGAKGRRGLGLGIMSVVRYVAGSAQQGGGAAGPGAGPALNGPAGAAAPSGSGTV